MRFSAVLSVCVAAVFVFGPIFNCAAQESTLLVLEKDVTPRPVDGAPGETRRARTILRGVPAPAGSNGGWNVATADGLRELGWIADSAATPLEQFRTELRARAAILAADAHPEVGDLPALIAAQDREAVRLAWQEVARAIAENEALPAEERLPDPYFARAEIWIATKNYADAIQDYLAGIRLAREQGRSPASYERHFERLASAAERLRQAPVAAARGGTGSYAEAAQQSFSEGYAEMFGGDSGRALRHFTNAVQLDPTHPLYWYYRSLVYRQAGRHDEAVHDAIIGAGFESESRGQRTFLNERLSRIQGPDRLWLETYRRGTFGT